MRKRDCYELLHFQILKFFGMTEFFFKSGKMIQHTKRNHAVK